MRICLAFLFERSVCNARHAATHYPHVGIKRTVVNRLERQRHGAGRVVTAENIFSPCVLESLPHGTFPARNVPGSALHKIAHQLGMSRHDRSNFLKRHVILLYHGKERIGFGRATEQHAVKTHPFSPGQWRMLHVIGAFYYRDTRTGKFAVCPRPGERRHEQCVGIY